MEDVSVCCAFEHGKLCTLAEGPIMLLLHFLLEALFGKFKVNWAREYSSLKQELASLPHTLNHKQVLGHLGIVFIGMLLCTDIAVEVSQQFFRRRN